MTTQTTEKHAVTLEYRGVKIRSSWCNEDLCRVCQSMNTKLKIRFDVENLNDLTTETINTIDDVIAMKEESGQILEILEEQALAQ